MKSTGISFIVKGEEGKEKGKTVSPKRECNVVTLPPSRFSLPTFTIALTATKGRADQASRAKDNDSATPYRFAKLRKLSGTLINTSLAFLRCAERNHASIKLTAEESTVSTLAKSMISSLPSVNCKPVLNRAVVVSMVK